LSVPVLVDATSIPENRGGVARYITGLLQGLDQSGSPVTVVTKSADREWLRATAPGHRYLDAPSLTASRPGRLVWEQLGLPLLARRLGVALVHSPHYTFPLLWARRSVVTLHDATFFSDPAAHGRVKRSFFRTWTRLARLLAFRTVAPSAATADEIERFVRRGHRTAVAHLGVDRGVFHVPSEGDVERFRGAHGIPQGERWIAFLGTVEPRKSVPALVEAHARLSSARGDVAPLLVAGGLGWDDEATALLRAAGDVPGSSLRHLGYLPLEELAAFLGGSDVVVYPSTGEGFGLPVLEAMACGGTVLTTRRLALPEVAGDAAAYAEPDADSLERALGDLLDDPRERSRLASAGTRRAAEFTWRACADAHRAVWAS
jgi:glycosyltransferase involved in cell wall biosynthesis